MVAVAEPVGPPVTRERHGLTLLVVFALVVVVDQTAKWFAWRHVGDAVINEGGYILLGRSVRAWFAAPTTGAVANGVGAVLVVAGIAWLLARGRHRATVIGGALTAAGWTANLLDRFGLHQWTAPGSRRGVIDFIPSGGPSRCNIADLAIVAGLVVLVLSFAIRHWRRSAAGSA